jgi:colicin import membrane protein
MFRRTEVAPDGSGREPDAPTPTGMTPAGNFVVDPAPPNLSGDLDAMLTTAPVFRTSVRGYDRLQVDNYVSWAEGELRAARRETDDLVDRYGRACAELEISRRLLARSPGGQEMTVISERMGRMLRMAADEAAALTASAQEEADSILADARTESDARLRKAHEIKQLAVEAGDRMREEARLLRAEATAELDRARARAAEVLREAEEERSRLAEEAAQERRQLAEQAAQERSRAEAELAKWLTDTRASARREQEETAAAAEAAMAEARGELEELHRRRDRACESLLRLNEQIGVALDTVADVGALAPAAGRGEPAAV